MRKWNLVKKMPEANRLLLLCWDGWGYGVNYLSHNVTRDDVQGKAPYLGYWDGKDWVYQWGGGDIDEPCYWMYAPKSPPNGDIELFDD